MVRLVLVSVGMGEILNVMIGKLQKISGNIKVSYHMPPVKYTPAM
jgi:hypothetical protein